MSDIDTLSKEEMNARVQLILDKDGYEGFVRGLFNRSGDPSKDFTHAVLGLRTECHELLQAPDQVNALEEGGDLMFYFNALEQVVKDWGLLSPVETLDLGAKHPAVDYVVSHTAQQSMEHSLNQLEDIAKRWVGYGKAPTGSVADIMFLASAAIRSALMLSLLRFHNLDRLEDVMVRANVAKLLKRYKGAAFDATLAVNRDTAAERTVLEDAAG